MVAFTSKLTLIPIGIGKCSNWASLHELFIHNATTVAQAICSNNLSKPFEKNFFDCPSLHQAPLGKIIAADWFL